MSIDIGGLIFLAVFLALFIGLVIFVLALFVFFMTTNMVLMSPTASLGAKRKMEEALTSKSEEVLKLEDGEKSIFPSLPCLVVIRSSSTDLFGMPLQKWPKNCLADVAITDRRISILWRKGPNNFLFSSTNIWFGKAAASAMPSTSLGNGEYVLEGSEHSTSEDGKEISELLDVKAVELGGALKTHINMSIVHPKAKEIAEYLGKSAPTA